MSIRLVNVGKIYKSGEVETVALKDINIEIKDGEFIVILGPSGSGKSTMLNVISGLDTPSSGEIYYNDEKISDYNEDKLTKFRRNNLGFIFQQYNLLQNLTVKENIEIGSSIGKNPLNIDEVLDAVSMKNEKDKYPYQLSGGQQQRVSIARSIAKNPKIMFCDEPTGALDEETGKQVLEMIQNMNERFKTTTVVITHNPNIAFMADRVIKMNSGKIVEEILNTKKRKASEIKWG
ncbi:ABC transporter ATP-binding protein [Romboutsia sp. 1001216sp1]|nr:MULTISPECIES: ABC transporter ATP-binding protein [unclassified Romboutsia]MDB8792520.1 ABC transporter ATP-binding protein [Romboutsia sp. 1001216sp1]MDB8795815.1 ABC transporter ATP-binding protein [Romboutsia sp. 1001216sp1]MDB8798306.1 ABC transporter ATP-binding protein [Romboutsia sp. 1001216sp1]